MNHSAINILLLYSTTDGHTRHICETIKQEIDKQVHNVSIHPIDHSGSVNLNNYDSIVIGASIRYGKHQPVVYQFIEDNRQLLDKKHSAFFTVNVVARKANKNTAETNPYMQKFLRSTSWKPDELLVIAGKIDYQMYKTWDRLIIRFIMWLTKGPTDPKTRIEFTDWDSVRAFAQTLCQSQDDNS